MSRYIDVDKIPFFIGTDAETGEEMMLVAMNQIEELPIADVVEVVRCEKCVYCKLDTSSLRYKCRRRGYITETVEPTFFCSKGARWESEDENEQKD